LSGCLLRRRTRMKKKVEVPAELLKFLADEVWVMASVHYSEVEPDRVERICEAVADVDRILRGDP